MRVTIGQYYPTGSAVHRLDPRVKLASAALYIALVFSARGPAAFAGAFAVLALVAWASKIPPGLFLRGLRGMLFVIAFIAATNVFLLHSGEVVFRAGFVRVTEGGLAAAAQMCARLALLVCGSSALTLATSPIELTDGIERLLRPLKAVGVPAHDIAMMATIAMRFVPTLAEELDKIMKAQKARGADFETGGPIRRGRKLLPVLVPLFVSAFKRAEELATAMEARCYRGDAGRTRMKEMRMGARDWLMGAFFAGLCAAAWALGAALG